MLLILAFMTRDMTRNIERLISNAYRVPTIGWLSFSQKIDAKKTCAPKHTLPSRTNANSCYLRSSAVQS
jgi:hypothetical protein